MKIVVNDIAASTGGAMTVLRDFYTFVCEHDCENQWVFLLADRYFEETGNVKIIPMPQVKKSGLRKLWFDFVSGRYFIRKLKPDVVFSLQNIITFGVKVPQAVYIHQSIPFQTVKKFSFLRGAERKLAVVQHLIGRIIKWSAKKSDLVIVQAKWMKDAVCKQCHIPAERVLVSMPTANVTAAEGGVFESTQFFYPTAPGLYKNNDCLFRASRLLRERGVEHTVCMTLSPAKSEEGIICTGRQPYEEVLRRYGTSTLVFPSYIETVGLPLLEGRAAGTVILAADTVFAREMLEGYENVHFFDPFKPEELADLMEQVVSGEITKKPVQPGAAPVGNGWPEVLERVLCCGKAWEEMKVLILTNIPSPYRVDFFNELGKLCELTVVFERGHSSERDASWKNFSTEHFTPVFLKGIKRGVANAVCPGVVKHLKKGRYDRIIVTNFTSATGMLAISWMRLRGIPYWLESDGGFAKSGSGMKEKIKRHFIKGAAGYFSTAEEHDRYYLQYGAEKACLHRYPFTSLYRRDVLDAPVSREQKQALRQKLGMTEENILLAVGQFIRRKGFDILIDAMANLPKNVGCYIVGGIPAQPYLEQVSGHGLENVHFVGFKNKADLAEYYMAADVFVHPTREDIWGLVVNEAMAKGLPVVTTDRCIAGLELVTEPGDGAIIPVGDAARLAQAIGNVLDTVSADHSARILEKTKGYSFEEMAKRHIEILTEH